jgi:tRNA1(Val) A37 N6-methylase TrmN6
MITPFSVLDTRTKEWKERKSYWIQGHGIQSELGREDTQSKTIFWDTPNTVSIFDPVLCELMYTWFAPKGGNVLDPFAGGSVRGIVAEELGLKYDGIELSQNQILANQSQSNKPNWILGDSEEELTKLKGKYDFIFTCPPYYDLEKYSDNQEDLSNMDTQSFDEKYRRILTKCGQKLKRNRFLVIVVSEVRELTVTGKYSTGKYKGLVRKTIQYLEDAGLEFYNDLILYNSQHQASRVSKTYFERNRKIPSVHQNVLVFVKGNPDIATEELQGGQPICKVEGKEYLSFRHAAIDIDADKLVASEVERRCRSTKSKYKDWQIIGEETKPNIRYSVDGIPFESPKQIAELIGGDFTEGMARNYINSNKPIYRHWKREEGWDITYEEMYQRWEGNIRLELPVINCEGKEFYSYQDAGDYFGLSDERVRQKIKSDKYKDWISLV